jgi:hypothetical protein
MMSNEGDTLPLALAGPVRRIALSGVTLIFPIGPCVIFTLLALACRCGSKYAIAALVAFLIWVAHLYAAFPLVQ